MDDVTKSLCLHRVYMDSVCSHLICPGPSELAQPRRRRRHRRQSLHDETQFLLRIDIVNDFLLRPLCHDVNYLFQTLSFRSLTRCKHTIPAKRCVYQYERVHAIFHQVERQQSGLYSGDYHRCLPAVLAAVLHHQPDQRLAQSPGQRQCDDHRDVCRLRQLVSQPRHLLNLQHRVQGSLQEDSVLSQLPKRRHVSELFKKGDFKREVPKS